MQSLRGSIAQYVSVESISFQIFKQISSICQTDKQQEFVIRNEVCKIKELSLTIGHVLGVERERNISDIMETAVTCSGTPCNN